MSLHDLLGVPKGVKRIVSICGAGGKTTLMYSLAREAAAAEKVSVFTTTHILRPQEPDVDVLIPFRQPECLQCWENGRIACTGTVSEKEDKLTAPREEAYRFVLDRSDAVFIEADGAKRLPLKYPAAWEPVIPKETTHIVAVAGLSALGKPADEIVHRYTLARNVITFAEGIITAQIMAEILWAGYSRYRPAFFLNQADDAESEQQGREAALALLEMGAERVVVASLRLGKGRVFCRD